jgi:L-arabinose isomerase
MQFAGSNNDRNCIGIIAWMHTFHCEHVDRWIKDPAEPLLHLHTQFNRDIPGMKSIWIS